MNAYEDYIIQRFKLIRKHLNNFAESKDKESLHQFRVEFKRLKMISHLTAFCNQSFNVEKELRKFRKLLKLSCKLRDDDVIQELLLKHHISLASNKKELSKRKKRIKQFCKIESEYKHTFKSLKKKLLKYADKIQKNCIAGYLAKIQNSIINNISVSDKETALHSIRKDAKQLKYLTEIQHDILSIEVKTFYNGLQELTGNWHDNLILVKYLEEIQPNLTTTINFLRQKKKEEASSILSKIKKAI